MRRMVRAWVWCSGCVAFYLLRQLRAIVYIKCKSNGKNLTLTGLALHCRRQRMMVGSMQILDVSLIPNCCWRFIRLSAGMQVWGHCFGAVAFLSSLSFASSVPLTPFCQRRVLAVPLLPPLWPP